MKLKGYKIFDFISQDFSDSSYTLIKCDFHKLLPYSIFTMIYFLIHYLTCLYFNKDLKTDIAIYSYFLLSFHVVPMVLTVPEIQTLMSQSKYQENRYM